MHSYSGAEMAVHVSSAIPRSAAIGGRSEPEFRGDDLPEDRLGWAGVQYEWDHLLHGSAADQIIMTEPPALRVVPDEEVSGLWLWHGAPPDQQQRQRVSRRGVRRLSRGTLWVRIGAALIVAGLSALAASVLIAARLTEPAGPWASSPATAAIATSTSLPPAADTPASPAAVAAAPQSVSAQESHPVAVKPGVVWRHRDPRFAKQTGTSLTDLLATPAFRNGTLRPVLDH